MPFKPSTISKYSTLIGSTDSVLASESSGRLRSHSCGNDFPHIRIENAAHVTSDDISSTHSNDDTTLPVDYINSNTVETAHTEKGPQVVTNSYKRRFWIIIVFSTLTWFSCLQWNMFGPISESLFAAFPDWHPSTVAMMENWVTMLFVFSVLPVCWAVGKFGIRPCIVMSTLLLAIGLSLRCVSNESPTFTTMCHLCAVLMGVSVTVILSAPPLIASAWFPQHERTRAVALIMAMAQLGSFASYLEPLFVKSPSQNVPVSVIKHEIMLLLYTGAVVGWVMFILILVYFPSKPPQPPSLSSSADRLFFGEALKSILRNKNFVIYVLIYGLATGPSLAWIGVLNISLKPLGFNQENAMYVGLTSVLSCFVVTILIGWLTDRLFAHLRTTIIVLLIASSFSYYWFLLLTHKVIDMTSWQVYVSTSLGLGLNYATIPLFFELAVEIAYPAPEVLIGGIVTASDSFFSSLFLFCYFLEERSFNWVTYVLVGSNALPILALLFTKIGYSRFNIDATVHT